MWFTTVDILVYIHAHLFIYLVLQISMSVNWRYIRAIPMPTVLTQMAALTAHVGKALKAMGSTVQVKSTFYTSI